MKAAEAPDASRCELVSVVIPARDEEAAIGRCLDSIRASRYPNLEILVVDGASTDRTAQVVEEVAAIDPRVRLLRNEAGIIPTALNLALASARGRWLVRVDAHSTIPPDYVDRAVEHLRCGWAAVGGRKDGVGETPAGKAIAAAMASRFGAGGSTYHHGTVRTEVEHVPFGAYPVDLARRIGGWDERLRVNQDYEFDHRVRRAGGRILFDPEMTIDWQCRQRIADLYRQYRRYGRGKARVVAMHPRSLKPRQLAAPALVAALALGIAAAPLRRAAPAVVAVPYLAALAAASATTPAPRGSRRWLPPAFLAMHLGWGIGFWEGIRDLVPALAPSRHGAAR